MIVVAAIGETRVYLFRASASGWDLFEMAVAIEKQVASVARPIRGFEASGRNVDYATVRRIDADRFQSAVESRFVPEFSGRILTLEKTAFSTISFS